MESKKPVNFMINPTDLIPISTFINENCSSDLIDLCRDLDRAVYMLHYLPEGQFDSKEIQNTSYILANLKEKFLDVYYRRIVKE